MVARVNDPRPGSKAAAPTRRPRGPTQPHRARRGRSRTATATATATVARRVLFASVATGLPTVSLRRAAALADLLDAELHVLRVLPEGGRSHVLFPHRQAADALATARLQVSLARRTRRWCASVLAQPLSAGHVRVRHGELGRAVAASVDELAAELVVMPARDGRDGALVTRIAAAAQVPELVARRAAAGEGVVVATDLSDPAFPLMHRGVELAQRLGAPVTFVHNVPPPEPEIPAGLGLALPLADPIITRSPGSALVARRLGRLRAQAERLHPGAESDDGRDSRGLARARGGRGGRRNARSFLVEPARRTQRRAAGRGARRAQRTGRPSERPRGR